jgi:hypothetical protein
VRLGSDIADLWPAGISGGMRRNITLVPRPNFADEDHPSTLGLDCDLRSIDRGAPLQCPLDLLFDL